MCAFIGFVLYAQREPPVGGDFSLTFNNRPWKFSEHSKKLNLFYTGYVKCPDVCPLTMSVASRAFKQLTDEEKSKVSFLFLSVDRDHDRPEDVATYASQFSTSFLGLSGSRDQIDYVSRLFGATYIIEDDPKSHLGYGVSHADRIYLLNKKGKVLYVIHFARDPEQILKAIRSRL
ncbi:MAG: SCO family protein [Proteobacteria bacterium]|nr:MAG: SCO family protein [Pseudomonadota bacterium]